MRAVATLRLVGYPILLTRTICRPLWITLLLGAVCTAVESQAGVIVSSTGHTAFGGASAWAASGLVLDHDGNQVDSWDHADFTPAYQLTRSVQNDNASIDLFNNVGTRTAGTATLSAAAKISAQNLQSGKIYARGWSLAMINDRIRVEPADVHMTHGTVQLEWTVHGNLDFGMVSQYAPLNSRQGLKWAHYATAQTFVSWRDPVTFVEQIQRTTADSIALNRINSGLTDEQKGGLHFLQTDGEPNPQTLNAEWYFADGMMEYAPPTSQVNQVRSFVQVYDAPMFASVDVMLGLFVSYNAVWDLEDFGGLDSNLESMFDQTAELTGVRLFDGNGAAYTGQWSLVSDNGMSYPVAAVPEPSAIVLIAAGGLFAGWMLPGVRRRRTRLP